MNRFHVRYREKILLPQLSRDARKDLFQAPQTAYAAPR